MTVAHKFCKGCERTLPRTNFSPRKERGPEAVRSKCKECNSAATAAYVADHLDERKAYAKQHKSDNRAYYSQKERERVALNPERKREQDRIWRMNNKDKVADAQRRWRSENPEKVAHAKRRDALSRHGITIEDYDQMLASQDYVCKICGSSDTGSAKKKYFSVDHCHDTGVVRGLLCQGCNSGLGHFKDDIVFLQAAIDYLLESRLP